MITARGTFTTTSMPCNCPTPIWIGGLVRWLVERRSSAQSQAEGDSSPGVLLCSGLIAGGAIAGMVLAIVAGGFEDFSQGLDLSGTLGFFATSDFVALGIFLLLAGWVFLVGRGRLLAAKN